MAHKNLLLLHFDITFDRNFSNLYHMFSLNSAIYTTLTLGLKPCKKAENAKQCFLFPEAFTEVFCKRDILRNFAKSTGKHLCQSIFLNKVAGLQLH